MATRLHAGGLLRRGLLDAVLPESDVCAYVIIESAALARMCRRCLGVGAVPARAAVLGPSLQHIIPVPSLLLLNGILGEAALACVRSGMIRTGRRKLAIVGKDSCTSNKSSRSLRSVVHSVISKQQWVDPSAVNPTMIRPLKDKPERHVLHFQPRCN